MNNNIRIFLLLLSFIVAIWLSKSLLESVSKKGLEPVTIGQTVIFAEISDEEHEREEGLSGRAPLKNNNGMLFVFDSPGNYQFWMKDMNFPIDIIWIGEDKHVVSVTKRVDPTSYPEIFGPVLPARYVLEVRSGFAEEKNIEPGDLVNFSL